jgi:hypothetical protein
MNEVILLIYIVVGISLWLYLARATLEKEPTPIASNMRMVIIFISFIVGAFWPLAFFGKVILEVFFPDKKGMK